MINPFQYMQDVRVEADKVTWPNRRETMITTLLVILMCIFAATFLFAADQAIRFAINLILGLGQLGTNGPS